MTEPGDELPTDTRRRHERNALIFILVFLFPLLSVAIVGGYGFMVWMSHLIMGPPGPP